jgi:hypothetical protein
MAAVHGETAEQRAVARAKRTRDRRASYYEGLMRAAPPGFDRLRHACDFLRAVAKDLAVPDAEQIAHDVTKMADEWNLR